MEIDVGEELLGGAVIFSTNGEYLLSGGREVGSSVARWQINGNDGTLSSGVSLCPRMGHGSQPGHPFLAV